MKVRDICETLCMIAWVFLIHGLILVIDYPQQTEVVDIPEVVETVVAEKTYDRVHAHHDVFRTVLDTTPVYYSVEPDVSEYNCLIYATESIGRYYITAYNHLETGGKMTASGKTCHEGLITTCAADLKYHRFGEYLEIGGKLYVVEDTGSAVKKRHIDIYFANYKEMARYGSNYQTIYKVTWPFGKPEEM